MVKARIFSIDFLLASVLFIIAVLLRFTNYTELSIWPDELNIYPRYAYATISNNWVWSPESMLMPPLFTYTLATLTYLVGGGLEIFRLVSIVFGSMSVFVMYFLGKTLFDRRVGALSAILLCFSSYHIMYSKIVMLEAILIFFILCTIYFFIKTYQEDNINYAYLCGIFLGLAGITKWNAILLYPVFVLFLLWTTKKINILFEKKFISILMISLAIQLPIWIYPFLVGENPLFFHVFGRFTSAKGTFYVYQQSPGILELISKGFDKFIHMLTDGSSVATLSLPWSSVFKIITSFLFVITILYYFYPVLKGKASETLIFLYFMVFNIFLAYYGTKFEYYLLWAVPAFYIMISNMGFRFLDHIRYVKKVSLTNTVRVISLVFLSIFILSYIYIGSMAPFVNKGELNGYEEQISNLKNIANPGDAIATSFYRGTAYYLDKYDMDMDYFPLYYETDVDIQMLKEVNPRFIITSKYYYDSVITSLISKIWINGYYNLITFTNTNMDSIEEGMILFERKDGPGYREENHNDGVTGSIDHDIFYATVPSQMIIGKQYDIMIIFKNTYNKTNVFIVTLDVPENYIFSSSKNRQIITLGKGESRNIKFRIVPIKQNDHHELNVTARLSTINSRRNLPSSFTELDYVSKPVLSIKQAHTIKEIVLYSLSTIMFSICAVLVARRFRYH